MASFHIDNRLKQLKDPLRTWNFELSFPQISKMVSTVLDPEPLIIRCRNAAIPSMANEIIESHFMGMKQLFPGKRTFDNTLAITFEEFEDMLVTNTMLEWQNKILNSDPSDVLTAGVSKATGKRDGIATIPYSTTAYLIMYKYNGDELPIKFKFVNIWPSSKAAVDLTYAASDSVKYNMTFSYDYWVTE